MTVGTAERMWSKDSLSYDSKDGRRRKVRLQAGYSVTADPTDSIENILDAEGLPRVMDAYPGNSQIRAVNVSPKRVSPVFYICLVTYEGESDDQNFAGDPTLTPPTIAWRNAFEDAEWDKAFTESDEVEPIETANHEKVHGITERLVDFVAVVERNYSFDAFNLGQLHAYLHSVNSDTIVTRGGTFEAGTARLLKFEPREVRDSSYGGYWKVNAEVAFRYPYQTDAAKAWWKRYLHEGFIMRVRPDTGADRLVNILDGNSDRSVKPLYLDEEGFPIADPSDAGTPPHYREQRTLLRLPYAALGLF